MLRHCFVTALIQSGVNVKVAQTLAGHHSAAFTLEQYADAVPQQLEDAGEKVAEVLLAASASIFVAAPKLVAEQSPQVVDLVVRPDGLFGAARLTPSGSPPGRRSPAPRRRCGRTRLFSVGSSNLRCRAPHAELQSQTENWVVRPERFELPTPWFEARYSIQLSYGRAAAV